MKLSRLGQATREAFGFGSEYRTVLPGDITEMEQRAQMLKKKYQSMVDKGNDLTGNKTGITSVFSKDKAVDKPIYGLGRMFENASKDYANEPLGEEYKLCGEVCMTLGGLEAEMHQRIHAKFVEPKEQFLKLDMKDASRQMDQVKNARLDLDNQKRKLANSTEAERKAHYEAKIVKAQETLDEELDYLRQILTILLAEDEEKKVQRASMMAMMQAMRDYHAKALAALQELDKKLDFDANSEYTPQPKPVPRRRERKAGEAAGIATSVAPPPYEDGPATPTDPVSSAAPSLPPRRESKSDVKVRVIYDFDGQQPGDLRLRQGDVITVLSQEGDWWEGILNGERGYFPANYVENA